jgi:membrane protease YdiL (CAAX protease family)
MLSRILPLLVWAALAPAWGEVAVPESPVPAMRAPAPEMLEDSAAAAAAGAASPPALGVPDGHPAGDDPEDHPRRRIRKHPHFKSDLWLPLGSAFLPGFGQYFQGDWTGAVYTGTAVAGFLLVLQGTSEIISDLGEDALKDDPNSLLFSESWSYRKIVLGSLAAQGSGFLSAYSAFRISVPRFQQEDGRYLFLGRRESVPELMASPFRFDHLLKPSTAIPLGLLAGGVGYLVNYERSHHRGARWTLSGDDFLFTGAEAWNAGVTEEAAFRGWIYPLAYQYLWQNFWLANGAQALLFGAAHFDSENNPIPWPQAVLGFYFGWLVKKNGWTLSESIFMHAWWDMILFAGEVATSYRADDPAARASFRVDLPVRW